MALSWGQHIVIMGSMGVNIGSMGVQQRFNGGHLGSSMVMRVKEGQCESRGSQKDLKRVKEVKVGQVRVTTL